MKHQQCIITAHYNLSVANEAKQTRLLRVLTTQTSSSH